MPRVKQFNEEEVLDKAVDLFWKKGYHATSMQDVVDQLGINRASIYDTYGGKQQLFEKAFTKYMSSNLEGLKIFLENQENAKEGFKKLFYQTIEQDINDCDKKGCFVTNVTSALAPGDPELQSILSAHSEAVEKAFNDFLVASERRGDFESGKDLKALAYFLLTLFNGIKVMTKVQTDQNKLLSSVDEALMLLE